MASSGGDRCSLGTIHELSTIERPTEARLAVRGDRGVVTWTNQDGLVVQPIDGEGAPTHPAVHHPIASVHRVLGASVDDGFLVALAVRGGLAVLPLGPDGSARGAPLEIAHPHGSDADWSDPHDSAYAIDGDLLIVQVGRIQCFFFVRRVGWRDGRVVQYESRNETGATTRECDDVDGHRVALHGAEAAVLFDAKLLHPDGPPTRHAFVSLRERAFVLHHHPPVLSVALTGDRLELLMRGDPGLIVRQIAQRSADGRWTEADELRSVATLAPPFDRLLSVVTRSEGNALVLERRNAAGDAVGPPLTIDSIDPSHPTASWAWNGERIIVAWIKRSENAWRAYARPVQCANAIDRSPR